MEVKRTRILAVVAALTIVGAFISIYRTMAPASSKINRQPFVGLGQVLAEETAKALGDHGRVVVVMAGTNDTLNAFRDILKKHPHIEITATEDIRSDTTKSSILGELSSDTFNDLVEKYAKADGLVFFTGLPPVESTPPLQLPTVHPQIIAVQISQRLTKSYFERKITNVAIGLGHQAGTDSAANPTTTREWFDKYFHVITPQNYATLPD